MTIVSLSKKAAKNETQEISNQADFKAKNEPLDREAVLVELKKRAAVLKYFEENGANKRIGPDIKLALAEINKLIEELKE